MALAKNDAAVGVGCSAELAGAPLPRPFRHCSDGGAKKFVYRLRRLEHASDIWFQYDGHGALGHLLREAIRPGFRIVEAILRT